MALFDATLTEEDEKKLGIPGLPGVMAQPSAVFQDPEAQRMLNRAPDTRGSNVPAWAKQKAQPQPDTYEPKETPMNAPLALDKPMAPKTQQAVAGQFGGVAPNKKMNESGIPQLSEKELAATDRAAEAFRKQTPDLSDAERGQTFAQHAPQIIQQMVESQGGKDAIGIEADRTFDPDKMNRMAEAIVAKFSSGNLDAAANENMKRLQQVYYNSGGIMGGTNQEALKAAANMPRELFDAQRALAVSNMGTIGTGETERQRLAQGMITTELAQNLNDKNSPQKLSLQKQGREQGWWNEAWNDLTMNELTVNNGFVQAFAQWSGLAGEKVTLGMDYMKNGPKYTSIIERSDRVLKGVPERNGMPATKGLPDLQDFTFDMTAWAKGAGYLNTIFPFFDNTTRSEMEQLLRDGQDAGIINATGVYTKQGFINAIENVKKYYANKAAVGSTFFEQVKPMLGLPEGTVQGSAPTQQGAPQGAQAPTSTPSSFKDWKTKKGIQ